MFFFGLFDDNQDGYISKDEYQDLFSILLTEGLYSEEVFNKIDLNKDGRLSRYELIPAIRTFLISDNPNQPGNLVFGDWKKI